MLFPRRFQHLALIAAIFLVFSLAPSRGDDCDKDGVDDAVGLVTCPTTNVVFLIDTSTSAQTDVPAVCRAIRGALSALGANVNAEILQM